MGMDLFTLSAKLSLDSSGYTSGIDAASGKTKSGFDVMSSLTVAFGNVVSDIFGQATAAVQGFVNGIVDTGSSYDTALSQIAATMGTTVDDTEKGMDQLDAAAQHLGATTKFTATEAAEGINILAMSGLQTKDILAEDANGASILSTTLDLATAGSLDMASAASYLTGSIKGFGDEASNAAHYADLIAKGATLANTNVNDLGLALSQSAATASSYGQKAEGVTLALLKLAEQNVTGANASTALGAAMKNLYSPTDTASKTLKKLGVSAYTSKGKAREFNDVVTDLDKALGKMSDKDRAAAIDDIFGIQGADAFNKMVATSTDTVKRFTEGIDEAAGSTTQQASTMLNNLEGQKTLFESAVSGLQYTLYTFISGGLTSMYQFGNEAITALNEAIQAGDLSKFGTYLYTKIQEGLKAILPKIQTFGKDIITNIVSGVKNAPTAISSFVTTFVEKLKTAFASAKTKVTAIGTTIIKVITDSLKNIGSGASSLMSMGTGLIDKLKDGIQSAISKGIDFGTSVVKIGQGIVEKIRSGIINSIPMLGSGLVSLVTQGIQYVSKAVPTAVSAAVAVFETYLKARVAKFEFISDVIVSGFSSLVNSISANQGTLLSVGESIVSSIYDGVISAYGFMADMAAGIIDGLLSNIANNMDSIADIGGKILSFLGEGLITGVSILQEKIPLLISAIASGFSEHWESIKENGTKILNAIGEGISGAFSWLKEKATEIVSNIASAIVTAAPGLVEKGKTLVSNVISGIQKKFTELKQSAVKIYNQVASAIQSNLPQMIEKGKAIVSNIISGISNTLSTIYDEGAEICGKVVSAIQDKLPDIISAGENIITNIVTGIGNLLDTAGEKAKEIVDAVKGKFDDIDWKSIGHDLAQFIIDGITEMITFVIDAGKAIGDAIFNILSSKGTSDDHFDWEGLGSDIVDTLITGLKGVLTSLGECAIELAQKIWDSITGFDWLALGKSIVDSIVSGIKSIGSNIASTILGFIPDWAKSALGLQSQETGEDIVDGMVSGALGEQNSFNNAVSSVATGGVDAANKATDTHSPSRLYRDEVGKYIGLGIAEGIADTQNDVDSAIASLVSPSSSYTSAYTGKSSNSGGVNDTLERLGNIIVSAIQRSGMDNQVIQLDGRELGRTLRRGMEVGFV